MSAYRVMVPNSWTFRVVHNKQYNFQQCNKIKKMLTLLNEETDNIYYDEIKEAQLNLKFYSYEAADLFKKLRENDLRAIYNSKPLFWKFKTYIKEYFPILLKLYRKIKYQ